MLLPHSLWSTQVNLAPTTGVIAGGLGTSLTARPAVGSIMHRKTNRCANISRSDYWFHHLSDSKLGLPEIELLEVPPAVFAAPVVRESICMVIQSRHLRASHFAFPATQSWRHSKCFNLPQPCRWTVPLEAELSVKICPLGSLPHSFIMFIKHKISVMPIMIAFNSASAELKATTFWVHDQ